MKNFSFLHLLVLTAALLFMQCEKDTTSVGETPIDYANIPVIDYQTHVQPLLNEYAGILQNAGVYPPGLQMDSWENLIKGWERGEAVIPFDAENSLLIELTTKLDYPGKLDSAKVNFLKRWINEGAKNSAGVVPYADATNLLYACDQGEAKVSIIDADRLVVIRTVDLTQYGLPISAKPHHIAFSPNGQYWFVSCIDNQVNKVLKFSVGDNQLLGEFATPIPALLDHHPTDNMLYVSRFMDLNNPQTAIAAANTTTMQGFDGASGTILLPPSLAIPHAMKINHAGTFVYTASFSEDMFLVIDRATHEFVDAVSLGNDRTPLQVAVTPDDRKAYVSCIGTGEIVVIDVSDPNNRVVENAVTVGGAPWHGVFTPDGSKFYIGNLMKNQFHVINTGDLSVQTFGSGDGTDGLIELHGAAVHPNGSRVFFSGRNTTGNYKPYYNFGDNAKIGTVVVVNTADNSIEKIIEIENFGSGLRMLSLSGINR